MRIKTPRRQAESRLLELHLVEKRSTAADGRLESREKDFCSLLFLDRQQKYSGCLPRYFPGYSLHGKFFVFWVDRKACSLYAILRSDVLNNDIMVRNLIESDGDRTRGNHTLQQ